MSRPAGSLRPLAALAVALALVVASPAAAQPRPRLTRPTAAILVDGRDGKLLSAKDPNERHSTASTTKLMTALLVLERARPKQVFTGADYHPLAVESKINLAPGERMRVDDLMRALLLESANDAAIALAKGVSGSTGAFVAAMNRRAAELGLTGTHYTNPIGLDDPDNYSTPRDLAALASRLLQSRRFAGTVRLPSAQLRSGSHARVVHNRNDLVRRQVYPVDGVKTGHTISAGYVLVGSADERGARLVSVVMGEPSDGARDADTLALLRWGLSLYRRRPVLDSARRVVRVKVDGRDRRAELLPAHDLNVTVRRGQRIGRRVDVPGKLKGPLPAGRPVGSVAILRDGKVVGRVALLTAGKVPGPGSAGAIRVALTALLLAGILVAAVLAARTVRERARAGVR